MGEDAPELWSDPTRPPGLLTLGAVAAGGDDPTAYTDAELARTLHCQVAWITPWNPDYAPEVAVYARHADTLLPLAERWLAEAASHAWLRPFDGTRQGLVQHPGCPAPVESRFVPPTGAPEITGAWFPLIGGLRGTTLLDPGPVPARMDFEPNPDVRLWHLEVATDARVLEIATPADWLDLVERFPARAARVNTQSLAHRLPLYGVDWERAATEYDGIRFRIDAVIRMGFMQFPVLDGVTVWIPDDPQDETVWLRWVFDRVEDLGDLGDHLRRADEEEARALPAGEDLEGWHGRRQNTARARRFRRIERAATNDPGLAAVLYDLPSDLSAVSTATPLVAVDPRAVPESDEETTFLSPLLETPLDDSGRFRFPDHTVDLDDAEDRLYVDFSPFRHPTPGGRTIELDDRRRYDVEADGTLRGVEIDRVSDGVLLDGLPETGRLREVLADLGIPVLGGGAA